MCIKLLQHSSIQPLFFSSILYLFSSISNSPCTSIYLHFKRRLRLPSLFFPPFFFLFFLIFFPHDYTTEPSRVIKQHHCGWKPFWLKGARALQLWRRGLGERSGCWRLLATSRLVMLCSLFPTSRSLLQRGCSEVKDRHCRKYFMESTIFSCSVLKLDVDCLQCSG